MQVSAAPLNQFAERFIFLKSLDNSSLEYSALTDWVCAGRFSQKVEGYEATLVSMLNARAASLQGLKVKRLRSCP